MSTTGQIALREQSCANCRYSRRSTVHAPDRALSCRFLPPQPCTDPNWRLVPEDFWCGHWERGPLEPLTSASQATHQGGQQVPNP